MRKHNLFICDHKHYINKAFDRAFTGFVILLMLFIYLFVQYDRKQYGDYKYKLGLKEGIEVSLELRAMPVHTFNNMEE